MEDETQLLYRIWLTICCDHNPNQVQRLVDEIGTPEEIFHTDLYKKKFSSKLKLGQLLRLDRTLHSAEQLLERCRQKGIRVVSIEDKAYPDGLRQVYAPPQVLYVFGKEIDLNQMLGVTVVGTRKGTGEGERFAGMLGRELAENGVMVVSGMALGMDGAAHWGALEAGGTTVAVLAGGVDVIYPAKHRELYRHIQTHGCILSEQPPGAVGQRYFYQQRNRILVGLSRGVVIVEGGSKSGTSITARLAQENNRDIFAVPGNPLNGMAELPNALLRDGAIPLTDTMDIIEEYIALYPEQLAYGISQKGRPVIGGLRSDLKPVSWEQKIKPTEKKPASVPIQELVEGWIARNMPQPEEMKIVRFLGKQGGRADYDDIAEACEMEAAALSSALIILQMKKAVAPFPGGQYQLTVEE